MKFTHETNEVYLLDENDKKVARATFPFIVENVINVDHVFVDPVLRGQGMASKVMNEVYNHAKEHNYTVVNSCPYAIAWFKKNKDRHDVLNTDIEVQEACKII